MSKRGDIEYLIDIREAMGRIEIYIKKIDYKLVWETIKKRIPSADLQRGEKIGNMISDIKDGVDRAYENNMRMINLALIIYSYVKMMKK